MKTYLKLIALTFGIFITVSCDKNDKDTPEEYRVAEKQLQQDYSENYVLSDVNWTTERGYQIAKFSVQTKATAPTMTAWYSVTGDKANREMDSKNLGTDVPDKIETAFNATKYSDATKWKIDEIELENRYGEDDKISEEVYEMELESIGITPKLEAELFFSVTTGELLFSKESIDDDSDDADDKYVVTPALNAAVQLARPGAHILDAEMDDDQIEVEAIDTTKTPKMEIELTFNKTTYELIETEMEYKTTYETLPVEFNAIKTWFTDNAAKYTAPPATTEVEIKEGEFEEDGNKYKYEVEIEYIVGAKEYEVEFYITKGYAIIDYNVDID